MQTLLKLPCLALSAPSTSSSLYTGHLTLINVFLFLTGLLPASVLLTALWHETDISKFAKEVNILIRRDSIRNTAANYLAENISRTPNIKVLPHTEVISASGDTMLERITLKNTSTGGEVTVPARALFIYIGAKPATSWLDNFVLRTEKGFVITGSDLLREKSFKALWKLDREPFMPETSVPGVFASGDVRSTALTGISCAVGEGSMAIRYVRKYLEEM